MTIGVVEAARSSRVAPTILGKQKRCSRQNACCIGLYREKQAGILKYKTKDAKMDFAVVSGLEPPTLGF